MPAPCRSPPSASWTASGRWRSPLFIFGATGGMGMVIWGTLLQRRVPPHLLGRVSSLDFFVSLALMPVSMALAGPAAEVVPVGLIFLVAGTVSRSWPSSP